MRGSKRASVVALTAAVALVVAGCGGGDDDSTGSDDKNATGAITIDGTQPEVGLVPANTTETGGGDIVDFLWTGLVTYPAGGGDPKNALAESIETTDSQNYTIKLKKGTKFHDGTEVKSKNFVDAWNFAAYSPNGVQNGSFFGDIEGFADVHTEDPDGDGAQKAPQPKADKMSGLAIVDDYTFTVKLTAPFSIFPTKLGYSAYYPMPDAFFTQGMEAFGKNPIGNGPVKFVSWTDNVEIKLTRFDDYTLDDKVKIKDVTVKLYQEDAAAYADLLAGNLDYMQQVPVSALAGDKWKTDLGDRALEVDIPVMQLIAFPIYDAKFKNADLRKAISLAINRQEIAEKIFFGTRKPATSWARPGVPGGEGFTCTVCEYKPDEAKQLLQQAGGFTGELVFYYNADASHKEWMEAVANSVKSTLGINARAEGVPTFAVFRQNINGRKMTGPYRAGWQEDYPSAENWVGPLYITGGSSNDGLFSNPEVDKLYKEGTAAPNEDAAYAKFAEAMKIVDQQVPSIPIVSVVQQSGTSAKVKGVKANNVGSIDLSTVSLA
ncbi:peptide ABC transporter substrate-binding protein [Phytohabitans aurantiacus]|uniref:Peptide ABC transporter substrate-binding protein n=1 Tax=Phytohabitans aurantiacus TaxID=3016789 RepID=A0ABQ5QVT2_9ACTN|nr:ABC transporter substrate-binding protein [Phytohabitans aurantiacus]GLH97992.1 peptide ABC transporter substrate-binding protein [Phytohabitans aurantiacus]